MQDNCIKPISNSETQTFSLIYCVAGIVIVCHFVHFLMAFVYQEIKGLFTYLLTYKCIHRLRMLSFNLFSLFHILHINRSLYLFTYFTPE